MDQCKSYLCQFFNPDMLSCLCMLPVLGYCGIGYWPREKKFSYSIVTLAGRVTDIDIKTLVFAVKFL